LGAKDKDSASSSRANEDEGNQRALVESQEKLVFWARLAFFAASLYGAVAFWQGCLMHRTYSEMQKQTTINSSALIEAKNAVDTSQSQIDRTMDKMIIQTSAQIKAADAAKRAANIATETLHVSERAYLSAQNPKFRFDNNAIRIPLVNTGRLPTGMVSITMHTRVVNIGQTPRTFAKHRKLNPIPFGDSETALDIIIHDISKDAIFAGNQEITLAGVISYRDGFPETPIRSLTYCYQTTASHVTMDVYLVSCDEAIILPELQKEDGDYKVDRAQ
jgi:hypothetical protein